MALALVVAWVLALAAHGAYALRFAGSGTEEYRAVTRAAATLVAVDQPGAAIEVRYSVSCSGSVSGFSPSLTLTTAQEDPLPSPTATPLD